MLQVTTPSDMAPRSRQILHITATPGIKDGRFRPITKQFYVTVIGEEDDHDGPGPECHLASDSYTRSCHLVATPCEAQLWHAAFSFSSPSSGVRSVMVTPSSDPGYWVTDNFILGTGLGHQLYWTGDCCTRDLGLMVTDIRGEVGVCGAGAGIREAEDRSRMMMSVIVTIAVILLVVILACIAAILVLRRKREAQLEAMRQLPS